MWSTSASKTMAYRAWWIYQSGAKQCPKDFLRMFMDFSLTEVYFLGFSWESKEEGRKTHKACRGQYRRPARGRGCCFEIRRGFSLKPKFWHKKQQAQKVYLVFVGFGDFASLLACKLFASLLPCKLFASLLPCKLFASLLPCKHVWHTFGYWMLWHTFGY